MNLKTLASAATLLCTLAPLTLASAQSGTPAYVFETVDSIDADYYRALLNITGIVQGESAPRTITFYSNSTSTMAQSMRACERFALIAMNKPGQYYFEARGGTSSGVTGCKLTRR